MNKKRAAVLSLAACLGLTLAPGAAQAENPATSGIRSESSGAYVESGSFGTGRGGAAFWNDNASGERRFKTPARPGSEEPEEIKILPVRPEVYPVAPAPKPPLLVVPGENGSDL